MVGEEAGGETAGGTVRGGRERLEGARRNRGSRRFRQGMAGGRRNVPQREPRGRAATLREGLVGAVGRVEERVRAGGRGGGGRSVGGRARAVRRTRAAERAGERERQEEAERRREREMSPVIGHA